MAAPAVPVGGGAWAAAAMAEGGGAVAAPAMAEAGGDLAAAGMAKGRGARPVAACTIRSLPARGSAGHPSGLLHAHGSSSILPACLPGRRRPRQRQQGACLPGSGGSSSQPAA